MKLTRKLIAAVLSVCMVMALLTSASAAELEATYSPASYKDIAITTYSRMLAFKRDGAVPAADQTGKYGLISPNGTVLVPFQYDKLSLLGDGMFTAKNGSALSIIDAAGKVLFTPSSDCTGIYYQNKVIRIEKNHDDLSFEYYTPGTWESTTEDAYEGSSSSSGETDTTPDVLESYAHWHRAGDYYKVRTSDGKRGLLNSQGEAIIEPGDYTYVGSPNPDGYVSVTSENGGNVTTSIYNISNMSDTPKTVNKYVSTEVYFRHLTFSEDGQKWGMMGIDETVKLPAQYSVIDIGWDDGYIRTEASVENDYRTLYGMYDQDCNEVFATKYTWIVYEGDGYYTLEDEAKYGLSKVSGSTATQIIPCTYNRLDFYTPQYVEVNDGDKYTALNVSSGTAVKVIESSQALDVFGNDYYTPGLLIGNADLAIKIDGYTGSILPFIVSTGSSPDTVYIDYKSGLETNRLTGIQASNIDADGWFVYKDTSTGLYGFAHLGKDTPDPIENTITIAASANGTVTADKATAATGDTVTITATPAQGYQCSGITVTTATGVKVEPTGSGASYTFVMPAEAVTVTGQFKLPENANLRIGNVTPDVVGFAKVKVSGMMADRVYVIRLAESDKLDKNSAILVVNNQTEYAFTCKAGQNISVLEFEKMADLQGVTGADGKVHLTPITEKSHTSARIG